MLRTANNDCAQQVHGSVILNTFFKTTSGSTICIRMTYFVVTGLLFHIFIGLPFLASELIHSITPSRIILHFPDHPQQLYHIPKFHIRSKQAITINSSIILPETATNIKVYIPPSSSKSISTDLCRTLVAHEPFDGSYKLFASPDLSKFNSHFPFHKLPYYLVEIHNFSHFPVTIDPDTVIGSISTDTPPSTSGNIHTLTNILQHPFNNNFSLNQDPEFKPPSDCLPGHTSPSSSSPTTLDVLFSAMTEHTLSDSEIIERQHDLQSKGHFQRSISEVLATNRASSLEAETDHPFTPKADDILLNEINIEHLSNEQQLHVRELLKNNLNCFTRFEYDLGNCNLFEATAPLLTDQNQIIYAKYVPISNQFRDPAQKLIDNYVRCGVLEPTTDTCIFTSNIFIIKKKNNKFRLIFDGRLISKHCHNLPLSLGNIEEIFCNFSGCRFLTSLDVQKAYDQISVDLKTSKLLSFFGPNGKRYRYKRLGQGLKFSSFYLNKMMNIILNDIPHTYHYADDVFIASPKHHTFKDHLELLERVIQAFHKANVKLSLAKMQIAAQQVDFLGLTWTVNKLSIPRSKLNAYYSLKIPRTFKEARLLINSLAFYRRFIPNFSHLISPILELIKEGKKAFKWLPIHQSAVNSLISSLEKGSSVHIPDPSKPFIIRTDASFVAAAALVNQVDDDGYEALVCAVSRSFTQSERKLAPVHKELLTLLYTLNSCDYILRGAKLRIFCDAKCIAFIKTCSLSSPYLARLALDLSVYDFEVFHVPGTLNVEADALSRLHFKNDEILTNDKILNNSMTKEESLRFLQYLTIPTNFRLTVSEIRQLISSEPLKTELDKQVKTKYRGLCKTTNDNSVDVKRGKKTHEPRYSNYHPLERRQPRPRFHDERQDKFNDQPSVFCTQPLSSIPFATAFSTAGDQLPSSFTIFALNSIVGLAPQISDTLETLPIKTRLFTTGSISLNDFHKAQEADVHISGILQQSPLPSKFIIKDKILHRLTGTGFKPYLPASLELLLFQSTHFHILAGHRAATAMISQIKDSFFIPDLNNKVKTFTANCFLCKLAKSAKTPTSSQGKTRQAFRPRSHLAFDIFTLPHCNSYRYVYTFICSFSLYTINVKAKTKTTEEILAAFLHIFALWSTIPLFVYSDGEAGLSTDTAKRFFDSFKVTAIQGPAHSPWANLAERSVDKSKAFLRSVLFSDSTLPWTQALDLATIAMNQTKTIYNYTPYQLFYNSPHLDNPFLVTETICNNITQYMDLVTKRYNDMVTTVNKERTESINSRQTAINKRKKLRSFEIDDLVLVKNLTIEKDKATKARYTGPYVVLGKPSSHSYVLASPQKPSIPHKTAHINHIIPFTHNLDSASINPVSLVPAKTE